MGTTEAAFDSYRQVFGTDYSMPIMRLGDGPPDDQGPELTEAEQNLVMHVELPILAGHVLMGTDVVESMGHELQLGSNVTINLEPETERLFEPAT
jgi:PhnB protein